MTSPDNDPEKLVVVVAVVALPLKLAVIVPAEKLPDPSRATIVFAVLELVASVARVISLELLVIMICEPCSNDLKFKVLYVLSKGPTL